MGSFSPDGTLQYSWVGALTGSSQTHGRQYPQPLPERRGPSPHPYGDSLFTRETWKGRPD